MKGNCDLKNYVIIYIFRYIFFNHTLDLPEILYVVPVHGTRNELENTLIGVFENTMV